MSLRQAQTAQGVDLSTTAAAELLITIIQEQFSGIVMFQKEKIVRKALFHEGALVNITSNLRSETLAPLLVALKKISEEEANTIATMMTTQKATPAQLLAALKRFTTEEIHSLLELVSRQRLQGVVSLDSGVAKAQAKEGAQGGLTHTLRSVFDGISQHMNQVRVSHYVPTLNKNNCCRYNADRFEGMADFPWSPEEKGLAMVASETDSIANIFATSLLEEDEIYQNIYKLHLLNIIIIETPESQEERKLEGALSDEQKTLKQQFDGLRTKADSDDYFVLFNVDRVAGSSQVESAFQKLQATFPKSDILGLYPSSMKPSIEDFYERLRAIYAILRDEAKRKEYLLFLEKGGQGRFEEQSSLMAGDSIITQGTKLFSSQQHKEAYNVFLQGTQSVPNDARLRAWAGIALFRASQGASSQEAKALIQQAITQDGECVDGHLRMGEVLYSEGNKEGAIQHLKEVLRIKPDTAYALKLLEKIDPNAKSLAEIEGLHAKLNTIDYYGLLGVARDTNKVTIVKAYHTRTRTFHPDRFFTSEDDTLKKKARDIYKRAVEAYMVLKNPAKRKEYDQQLQSVGGGDSTLRLKDAGDVVQRKEKSGPTINNPQARKFYELGVTSLQTKNITGAIMNLQLALNAEPGNPLIEKKLNEAKKAQGA